MAAAVRHLLGYLLLSLPPGAQGSRAPPQEARAWGSLVVFGQESHQNAHRCGLGQGQDTRPLRTRPRAGHRPGLRHVFQAEHEGETPEQQQELPP